MNFVYICLVAFIVSLVAAYQQPDLDALIEFCEKEANKKYCDQIAQLASESLHDQQQIQMEKRKPSFVRFGKRSSPVFDEFEDQQQPAMEKRKPSFVRFGRK